MDKLILAPAFLGMSLIWLYAAKAEPNNPIWVYLCGTCATISAVIGMYILVR